MSSFTTDRPIATLPTSSEYIDDNWLNLSSDRYGVASDFGVDEDNFSNVAARLRSRKVNDTRDAKSRAVNVTNVTYVSAPDSWQKANSKAGWSKTIGADLALLHGQLDQYRHQAISNQRSFIPENPLLQTQQGKVLVDITRSSRSKATSLQLEQIGFVQTGAWGRVVSGFLPIRALPELAQIQGVKFARAAYQPIAHVGQVTSQGDIALKADVVRNTLGFDGTGVTIGVLSDSFDNLNGAASDVITGDLPEGVVVLEDLFRGGSDEGRAMLQLIHDVAPGANLAFHTAFNGQADFAQGILDLAAAGSDVIVDDIIYFAEPFFQDGIIAQAVDQVVAQGVAYFSAAGNSGRKAYESTFRPSGEILDFGNFQVEAHDFDPGIGVDIFQRITIPVGATVTFSFQWDSPFFSLGSGSGAQNDLDIFLFDRFGQTVLAGSADNNVGEDPVEIFSFTNRGQSGSNRFNLAIGKYAGADPGLLKYVGFGSLQIREYDTASGSLFGHANAKGAQAVGAAFFAETPAFGVNPPEVEPFSAAGTTPILFDPQGNRLLQPEVRQKPEIVAPDGTNTTFFGTDIPEDADTFPNFFGTSAAAPHAAAVAALLKQAAPQADPATIYRILQETAIDMDDPLTPAFDVGIDNATGAGLIQADLAVQRILENPVTPLSDPLNPETGSETAGIWMGQRGSDQLIGDRRNNLLLGDRGADFLNGRQGDDVLFGGKGRDTLVGGAGRDIFVLELNSGQSTVLDFVIRQDRLGLMDGLRRRDLERVQQGQDAVIQFQNRSLIRLLDTQVSELTAAHFVQV
jgi:subtilisin family serine protease